VAEAGANINEVHHRRSFIMLSGQSVEIELVIQTHGGEHTQTVLAALNAGGFDSQQL
jgi:hypothetical protein